MQKKILILSELFGSGHTKAAEALAQGIAQLEPSIHTQIVEIGKMLHPTRSAIFFRLYKKLITMYPLLWKKIYESKQNQPISQWLQFTIYQLFHRNIEQMLDQIQPDLVICTHPFNSSSIAWLKKMGYPISLCTVITDFHAHGIWVQPEVDLYLVSDDEVHHQLLQMGIPNYRIAVTGIPIKSNFWKITDKQEARRRLHLKNLPTVMIMGGGLGLGGIKKLAHSLIKWRESVQILICTGYNDSLRFNLQRNAHFQHQHIVIVGFVDMIDTLLDAVDLLITKPGGLTCFEALSKGVPMLIFQPIPGHEEYNSNHLVNQELAIRINHQDEVDHWIHRLLFSPESFAFLHSNMEQYQQKINPLSGALSIMDLLT
ncbi:MAG: MGDG synthase family glycosyltransferase [Bacillota bacterium]